ncbi:MAG: GAF domain-containing protein [Chloroflexi bacterium]|nr:GAF domain-containing protein [Anaerolineaceae bacterium]NMB90528.1 GAF domain-containing protein [Chloroflexota bacterium]
MQAPLKILHLEDDIYDVELIRGILQVEGIDNDVCHVATKRGFEAALGQQPFDLILADNSLPGFDGRSALALARELVPDVPFIFVSGTLGEEVAIEALKNGAADYVLKQRLQRLAPVIRRSLEQGEERQKRKQAEDESRRRMAQQAALNAILTAATHAGASSIQLLETTLEHTLSAFQAEQGMIWIELREVAVRGVPLEFAIDVERIALAHEVNLKGPISTSDWQRVQSEDGFVGEMAAVMARYGLRSDLVTPLMLNGKRIGGLSILSTRPRTWTQDEMTLVESIGHHLGIVIERARLFEETQRRVSQLEAMNRVSTAMRVARSLEEMLPMLLDETLSILHVTRGSIWLYDEELDRLRRAAARGWDWVKSEGPVKPGEEITGYVFSSGEVYVSKDFQSDAYMSAAARQQILLPLAGAAIPIRSAEKTIGVMLVVFDPRRELSQDELGLLMTLAEIAGNSITRMQLYTRTEVQLSHLIALRAIDVAINSSFDLRLTLRILLDQVTAQLNVDAADILLLGPSGQALDYAAGRGFVTPLIEKTHLPLDGTNLAGRTALERLPRCVPDHAQAVSGFTRPDMLAKEEFVAYYAFPLVVKDQLKGVLEIFHRAPLNTRQEWVAFLETLAGQAAIAIENSQLFESLQLSNAELAQAYDATIEGWSKALELRDQETEGHTQRVTELTLKLAQVMGVEEAHMVYIRWGALLHDIGKMGVPDSVLFKPGPLTEGEWEIMRRHPTYAYEMLSPISYLHQALDIPYCHHERWDGSGYPRGLNGEQIPLAARIFAVVDVWDALRSHRPYCPAWPDADVRAYIQEQSGQHFDPRIVATFLALPEVGAA